QPGATKSVGEQGCNQELTLLREMAERLEHAQTRLDRIAGEIAKFAVEMAVNEVRVPTLPAFRRTVWVDWLCVIPLDQALGEVTRVEYEVRAFLAGGVQPLRGKLQAARGWCLNTQESFLTTYWNQLRTHAQTHYVKDCDSTEMLQALIKRYDSDVVRRQREM